MLRGLGAVLAKDLRLLARDRAGLIFLAVAPVIVIAVAGFSLASLYGADPSGTSAYVLPFADEDHEWVGRAIRERLSGKSSVRLREVADREQARALLRAREAGVAVIVPPGVSRAVAEGKKATVLLFTDPVKYLEVANLRALVGELRHGLESGARERATQAIANARATRGVIQEQIVELRRQVDEAKARIEALRADAERRAATARERTEKEIREAVGAEATKRAVVIRERLTREIRSFERFLAELRSTQQAFDEWLAAVKQKAGRYADGLTPPPSPPAVPAEIQDLVDAGADAAAARLLAGLDDPIVLPPLPIVEAPRLPELPAIRVTEIPETPVGSLPGSIELEETSVTGAPNRLNTFDQNVPGFSVTFLLLGMLLGVSLGLLDERDWGTLARVRAMPVPFAATLVGKLLARFLVGVAQMVALFAIGRIAFGVSLGPQPWALLLPTTGIVFAGVAFGLVVAGVATSREAVLPVGSIVIVTMAAVGGCWWPIDLEPEWMRRAALAFPTTWAMAAFNDLMIRRQTFEAALRPTAVMFAYGVLYLALGIALFQRHAGRRIP